MADEEVVRELAEQSRNSYNGGDFAACIKTLEKLAESKSNEPSVQNNIQVAKFSAGQINKDELSDNLAKIAATPVAADESNVEHSCLVAAYNRALILFCARQYVSALTQLESAFSLIDAAEEDIAYNVAFLMLDTALKLSLPERTLPVMQWLDRNLKPEKEHKALETPTPDDVRRYNYYLYKGQLHLQTGAHKLCKREIKSCLNIDNQKPAGLFLKSNFEHTRGNSRKAVKLLNSCPSLQEDPQLPVYYYNNLGVIHFHMRKYSMASYYFAKAVEANSAYVQSEKAKGAVLAERDRRYELAYNVGVQRLHSGQPVDALRCLAKALPFYNSRALIWLHMAEACIAAHSQRMSEESASSSKSNVAREIVRGSAFTAVVLPSTDTDEKPANAKSMWSTGSDAEPTLHYALVCLRNALHLLDNAKDSWSFYSPSASSPSAAGGNAASKEITDRRLAVLSAVLLNLSYVCLGLHDHKGARKYAQRALSQQGQSDTIACLARMYCAEALLHLGEANAALELLSPAALTSLGAPFTDFGGVDQVPPPGSMMNNLRYRQRDEDFAYTTPAAAMMYNLAVAFCHTGDLPRAGHSLEQMGRYLAPHQSPPMCAVLLGTYIEIRKGNADLAVSLIKQHALPPPSYGVDASR